MFLSPLIEMVSAIIFVRRIRLPGSQGAAPAGDPFDGAQSLARRGPGSIPGVSVQARIDPNVAHHAK